MTKADRAVRFVVAGFFILVVTAAFYSVKSDNNCEKKLDELNMATHLLNQQYRGIAPGKDRLYQWLDAEMDEHFHYFRCGEDWFWVCDHNHYGGKNFAFSSEANNE